MQLGLLFLHSIVSGQAVCAMYKHAGELYHSDAILAQAGTSLRTGKACGPKSNQNLPSLPNPASEGGLGRPEGG